MTKSLQSALEYSSTWLDIIKTPDAHPDQKKAEWIISESIYNFSEHFNKGWLENRKSVTQGGMWAATEWH